MIGWELDFIANHRFAHLASVDSGERPHAIPIIYGFDGDKIYTPTEDTFRKTGPFQLARVRNILTNHRVFLVVDDYDDDWSKLAWVQVRGNAIVKTNGQDYEKGIDLLTLKYPQYKNEHLNGKPLIIITPQKINGWRATDLPGIAGIDARSFLGQNVDIRIDRAVGSRHPQYGFSYLVNYGCVPGIFATDGEELDAYLLGVFEPVASFSGKCIAIIHRLTDNEDKLIVVPDGSDFTNDQIRALTEFQERFFRSVIIRDKPETIFSTLITKRGE
jgi:inorganic pyrophosphatase